MCALEGHWDKSPVCALESVLEHQLLPLPVPLLFRCRRLSSSAPHMLPAMLLCLTTGTVTVDQTSEGEGRPFHPQGALPACSHSDGELHRVRQPHTTQGGERAQCIATIRSLAEGEKLGGKKGLRAGRSQWRGEHQERIPEG